MTPTVPEPGEPGEVAAEVEKIDADFRARLDEIDADFEAHCEELRNLAADPDLRARVLAALHTQGRVLMTEADAAEERRRLIGEARDDRLRRLDALERRQRILGEAAKPQKPQKPQPRRRPPDPLPHDLIEKLEPKIRERIAVLAAQGKAPKRLTHEAIANAIGEPFNRSRVQHGEKLVRAGWPLLRSLPQYSAESAVYWPSPEEAASILASEGAAEPPSRNSLT